MHDDPTLLRRWRDTRDETAFTELARRYADLVADVARCVAGDRVTAEDALQQALLRLALEPSDRPARVGVRAWLAAAALGIARNARTAARRRAARERVAAGRRWPVEARPEQPSAAIEAWLAPLDGEERALLRLRYAHGLEPAELARVYGQRPGAVRVRLHRALRKLRADAPPGRTRAVLVAHLFSRGAPLLPATVGAATRAALAAAAARAGPVAVPTSAGGLLVTGAAAVVALGLGGWWWAAHGEPEAIPGRAASVEEASVPDRPTLAGRAARGPLMSPARDAGAGAGVDGAHPPVDVSEPNAPTPRQVEACKSCPGPAPDLRPRARVRLLVRGTDEELPVERAWWGTEVFQVDAADPRIPLRPGVRLMLTTRDRRSAFADVTGTVPDPLPSEVVLWTVPRGDPRLAAVTLKVVDAKSRAPVTEAYVDLGPRVVGAGATRRADAEGRIRIDAEAALRLGGSPTEALPLEVALRHLFSPDHQPVGPENVGSGVSEERLETWLERGEVEVALAPSERPPARLDVRIARADGRPAAGVYVEGIAPWPEVDGVALRTDAEGLLTWRRAPSVLVLIVREDGAPVLNCVLSRETSRRLGVRTLTLPEVGVVDLEVPGFPLTDPASGKVAGSGARTMFSDVLDGLDKVEDREDLPTYVVDGKRRPPAEMAWRDARDDAEVVSADPPVLRWHLPAERVSRLTLSASGGEVRRLEVTPQPGAQRIVRRWDELTVVPRCVR